MHNSEEAQSSIAGAPSKTTARSLADILAYQLSAKGKKNLVPLYTTIKLGGQPDGPTSKGTVASTRGSHKSSSGSSIAISLHFSANTAERAQTLDQIVPSISPERKDSAHQQDTGFREPSSPFPPSQDGCLQDASLLSPGTRWGTVGTADKFQGGQWHAVIALDSVIGHKLTGAHQMSNGRLGVMASRHMTHLTWVHDGTWEDPMLEGAEIGLKVRRGLVGNLSSPPSHAKGPSGCWGLSAAQMCVRCPALGCRMCRYSPSGPDGAPGSRSDSSRAALLRLRHSMPL